MSNREKFGEKLKVKTITVDQKRNNPKYIKMKEQGEKE